MRVFSHQPLSTLCEIRSGGTPPRSNSNFYGGNIPWAKIADFENSDGIIYHTEEYLTSSGIDSIRGRIFPKGTLLFSIYGSIGKMSFAGVELATNQAILGIIPKTGAPIHMRFLYYWLLRQNRRLSADGVGVTQKNLSAEYVRNLLFPMIALDEQRRIAAILDKADAIRRKRQQALALADDFLRSAFLEMFGDPVTNPKGWQISPVEKLLGKPLRNGVSPSSTGRHPASVLTLSAITGQGFDPQSAKAGLFDLPVAVSDTVQKGEFYICRGNGNSNLVGKGYFATCSMEGTAFPDTMIAAMPDPELVTKEYFEQVWNSRFVRSQIVQAARTTNGTFKVNQTAIESIRVPVPPSNFQEEFSRKVMAAQRARVRILEGLEQAGTLFASLSQRAFRGEL